MHNFFVLALFGLLSFSSHTAYTAKNEAFQNKHEEEELTKEDISNIVKKLKEQFKDLTITEQQPDAQDIFTFEHDLTLYHPPMNGTPYRPRIVAPYEYLHYQNPQNIKACLESSLYLLANQTIRNDQEDISHFEEMFHGYFDEYQKRFPYLLSLDKIDNYKATKLTREIDRIPTDSCRIKHQKKILILRLLIQHTFPPTREIAFNILSFFVTQEAIRILKAPRNKNELSEAFINNFESFFWLFPEYVQQRIINTNLPANRNLLQAATPINTNKNQKNQYKDLIKLIPLIHYLFDKGLCLDPSTYPCINILSHKLKNLLQEAKRKFAKGDYDYTRQFKTSLEKILIYPDTSFLAQEIMLDERFFFPQNQQKKKKQKSKRQKKEEKLEHLVICSDVIIYLLARGFQTKEGFLTEEWWESAFEKMVIEVNNFIEQKYILKHNAIRAFHAIAHKVNIFLRRKPNFVSNFYHQCLHQAFESRRENLVTIIFKFLGKQEKILLNKKDRSPLLFYFFKQLARHEQFNPTLLDELPNTQTRLHDDERYEQRFNEYLSMIISFFDYARKKGFLKQLINLKNKHRTVLDYVNTFPNPEHKPLLLELLKQYDFDFSSCNKDTFYEAMLAALKKTYPGKKGRKVKLNFFFERKKNETYLLELAQELDDMRYLSYYEEQEKTSPLVAALVSGNIRFLKFLLEKGLDPNKTDEKNRNCAGNLTRLEKTSRRYSSREFRYEDDEDFLEVLRFLTRHETRFNDINNENGLTPFYWILYMARDGNLRPLETLIQQSTPATKICEAFVAEHHKGRLKRKNRSLIGSVIIDKRILERLLTFKNRNGDTLLQSCARNHELREEIKTMFNIAIQGLYRNLEDSNRIKLLDLVKKQ